MPFSEQERIYTVIMRSGTSKGVYLNENDLPRDQKLRDRVILSIFGSPDPRQIDGLGGAEPLTSKLALVARSDRPDADVDFTFGQVEIDQPVIHYSGLCGNIAAGVAPYAIEEGLVKAVEPVTTVRVFSTNNNQIFVTEVPVKNGKPQVIGDYAIDGVPGASAKINIDMSRTAGTVKGLLFPTGNVRDRIRVSGIGEIEVSVIDVVNPCIFVRAGDLGLRGDENPAEFNGNAAVIGVLENIRAKVAEDILGFTDWSKAETRDPNPFIVFVAPPKTYLNHLTKNMVQAGDVDLLSRVLFMGAMHQTHPGSISCVVGAAAVIPGAIANEAAGFKEMAQRVRIGHPGGVIAVEAAVAKGDSEPYKLTRAVYSRTVRRLMDGYAYVPKTVLK
jgi:2-methylaconitate cis-trans-isomerase PrpF